MNVGDDMKKFCANVHPHFGLIAAILSCCFAVEAGAQSQNGDVALCAAGRPCFTRHEQSGGSVTFWWNDGGERYDFYNVRYPTRAGEKQVENRSGRYTFTNIGRNEIYRIKVQGCAKPLIGRSRCSDWAEDAIRTR